MTTTLNIITEVVEALSLSIWPLVINDDGKPPKINMEVATGIVHRLEAHGYTITSINTSTSNDPTSHIKDATSPSNTPEPAPRVTSVTPDEGEKLMNGVCDYLHHEGSKDKLRAHIAALTAELETYRSNDKNGVYSNRTEKETD